MEAFRRKIRDEHPHLWTLLEEITTNKEIRSLDALRQNILLESVNSMNERTVAIGEFVAKHGMGAAPKTLAERGDSAAKKVMALAQKNMKLRELLQLAEQK